MNYAWLMAPHEYEPDYDAYWRDLELLEESMANVATYDDWFPDDRPIVAEQQGGGVMATENKVKPLDMSALLRDAFLAGRGLKDGDRLSKEDRAAWMAYDPERMAAYERIMQALYPGLYH